MHDIVRGGFDGVDLSAVHEDMEQESDPVQLPVNFNIQSRKQPTILSYLFNFLPYAPSLNQLDIYNGAIEPIMITSRQL